MNVATDIEKQVIELAAEHAGVEPGEVSAATHFVNDLHFDSLEPGRDHDGVRGLFQHHDPRTKRPRQPPR